VLGLGERASFGRGQQVPCRAPLPGLGLDARGGQRSPGPRCGVERQHGRTLEERGRRGQPASRPRPAGRMLQLGGDVLIRPWAAIARCQARWSASSSGSMLSGA